jgi:F-type H+-transporting ATPase subunit delta
MSKVGRRTLAAVLAERFAEVKDPAELEREVAAYLMSERRTAELESLLRDISQYRADNGHVEADVVSAFPLSSTVKRDLEQVIKRAYPEAKRITLSDRIDSDVVGGVRLELPNQLLDATVRAKLNEFKQLTVMEKR